VRFFVAIAVLAFAIALQTAVLPEIVILGVQPQLLVVVAVMWTTIRGLDEGRVVVFGTALVYGLLSAEPAGFPLIAMAPVVPLVLLRDAGIISSRFLTALALVLVATLCYEAITTLLLTLTAGSVNLFETIYRVYLPAMAVNLLLAPFVYLAISGASWDLRARRYA
jgi:hypothetical protein